MTINLELEMYVLDRLTRQEKHIDSQMKSKKRWLFCFRNQQSVTLDNGKVKYKKF